MLLWFQDVVGDFQKGVPKKGWRFPNGGPNKGLENPKMILEIYPGCNFDILGVIVGFVSPKKKDIHIETLGAWEKKIYIYIHIYILSKNNNSNLV
jgi:hypothetical protein